MALYAVTKSVGTATSWATGISLLLVTVSFWRYYVDRVEEQSLGDTKRGEWTNKMLFYGLVCVIGFIIA